MKSVCMGTFCIKDVSILVPGTLYRKSARRFIVYKSVSSIQHFGRPWVKHKRRKVFFF